MVSSHRVASLDRREQRRIRVLPWAPRSHALGRAVSSLGQKARPRARLYRSLGLREGGGGGVLLLSPRLPSAARPIRLFRVRVSDQHSFSV